MTDLDELIERDVAVNKQILDFCEQFDGKPCEWGVDDCTMFAAQWAMVRLDQQILFKPYHSEEQARATIEKYGSLVNLWGEMAQMNGIPKVHDRIQAGDIGIIHTYRHGDVGCIFLKYGASVAIRTDESCGFLGIREKHVLGAWRLP